MTEPEPAGDTHLVAPKATASPALTPAPARPACLVHIYPPGRDAGRRHPLDRPLRIGRAEDSDVRLDDHSISRRHARIDPDGGGHVVSDLGSTNGTRVNDEPVVGGRALCDGDYVRVGDVMYRYLAGGNVEAEYHEEIYRLAIQDPLTRLPNRRALDAFLEREVSRSRRHARPLSVVLFDLDRFKAINDTHGHLCGDDVLRHAADLLRRAARAEDLCARYGGEEFALVLVETGHADAVTVAERVRASVAGHLFRTEAGALAVTTSAGVATMCGDETIGASELLRLADERLYQAKRGGRDRVVGEADGKVGAAER